MRKFADKEQSSNQTIKQTNKQINGSNTEATLILCGYSGERANYLQLSCKQRIKTEVRNRYEADASEHLHPHPAGAWHHRQA